MAENITAEERNRICEVIAEWTWERFYEDVEVLHPDFPWPTPSPDEEPTLENEMIITFVSHLLPASALREALAESEARGSK